jgi:hypothetical protein
VQQLAEPRRAIFTGDAFDLCTARSTATMRSWLASPYRAVNMYIGGKARAKACRPQPELTPEWVSTVTTNGWSLIPTFVDLQPPCSTSGKKTFTAAGARDAGRDAAERAAARMQALNLGPGNIVYDDFEIFDDTRKRCAAAAVDFVEAWTLRLHALGYKAGMYAVADWNGVERGLDVFATDADPRPDAIWFNNWHTGRILTDPDLHGHWKGHRIHQYRGDHDETYSGVTLNIDSNVAKGDVAGAVTPTRPVGPPYVYYASPPNDGVTSVNERTAPRTDALRVGTHPWNTELDITCQAVGEKVMGSYVWDRLVSGNYVADINTTTTGGLGFTAGIPRCDKADPSVTAAPVPAVTLAGHRTFGWTGADLTTGDAPKSGIASYDVRWRRSGPSTGYGPWHVVADAKCKALTLSHESAYTYCTQVRATDRSGNRSDWTPQVCTVRPLDDRALAISSGEWRRQTGSSFWLRTATTTGVDGGRLLRRDVTARTFGLVATVCGSCGEVRVKIGRRTVGTVDLAASSRRYRVVLLLPAGSIRDGAVKLIGKGGRVQLDGLVVSRAVF